MKYKEYYIVILIVLLVFLVGCNSNKKIELKPPDEINVLTSEENNKSMQLEDVVLINGITLNEKDREIDIVSIPDIQTSTLKKKYEREYYAYQNSDFLGKFVGKSQPRGLDYNWEVDFDMKSQGCVVYLSNAFNPYPRSLVKLPPEKLSDFINTVKNISKQFDIEVFIKELISVDLDNCGQNEFILYACNEEKNSHYVCLLDKNKNIISYLMALINDEFINNNIDNINFNYNIEDDIEIIDVDNDNIMEILVNMPAYEGFMFNTYKYNKGSFNGKNINECSITP